MRVADVFIKTGKLREFLIIMIHSIKLIMFPIINSNYGELNKRVEKATNFKTKRHRIEFYGLCDKCSKKMV